MNYFVELNYIYGACFIPKNAEFKTLEEAYEFINKYKYYHCLKWRIYKGICVEVQK